MARGVSEPTLLIDGDMRSPDVHNVFEIPLEPGLAAVLSSQCTVEDAIVRTWSDHVHLLPAGRLQVNPHQLLANGGFQSLLAELRDKYRYVVIDTPPVLSASEAIVLAKASDTCLVCVMRDVSRMDQVRKTCDRLSASGVRVTGAVFSGVPVREYAYRYGDYGYSRD